MDDNIKLLYILLLSNQVQIPEDMGYRAGTQALLHGNVEMCTLNRENLARAVWQVILDEQDPPIMITAAQ